MNIEFLQNAINLFKTEVVDSGFKRDLDDYASSISASQGNILALREIANKLLSALDHIYATDLPDYLKILLPSPKGGEQAFTTERHDSELRSIIQDTAIQLPEFFTRLNQFIAKLKSKVEGNSDEIIKIENFIIPYIKIEKKRIANKDLAIIAIKFNDSPTISSLKLFSKTLIAWNKILLIYHQLIRSESPHDIEIVEVQNGSIDVIINLNVNVAINLVEVCLVGFAVFWGYLNYKREFKHIADTFHGNAKLISLEEDKENLLLGNIHDAIKKCIMDQHEEAEKIDGNIDKTAVPKKVEQVAKLITSHITKGNDIKLLAYPNKEIAEETKEQTQNKIDNLLEQSSRARREFRLLSEGTKQKLLEAYGEIPEEE